jgi:SPASM domain peptide maturase of grasp-with-spasm system
MKNQHFKLYSCCIPVMGKAGSIIVNLQKSSYTVIPQFLCEILQNYDGMSLGELEKTYDDGEENISQYFQTLSANGLGFFTDEPQRFPGMSLQWDTPEVIRQCVLQVEDYSRFDYKNVLAQLDQLLCKYVEAWFTGSYTCTELEDLLAFSECSVLRSLTLILPYNPSMQINDYEELAARYKKAGQIYLHQAPETYKNPETRVYATTESFGDFQKTFKNIPPDEYIIFLDFFLESLNFNPYYNRKICIDADGYLKNCLTHKNHFGNIAGRALEEVAHDEEFRNLWYASNDRILGIKDSEFRYIWLNTHELKKTAGGYYQIVEH